ncbi:hypothetical protein [Anaerocolumna sp. MB42-C2]|uniref:hypothetical protein n=1 Tax=Anaerocolumna sp. MB42-C2 TaxID=3070997 RepID=UPI0027E20F88|nr:hypothetical protein [Anaerocolumna sp. MB42-C2]WMJ87896.1 hypothetical protein RBU59_28380 [Anaerocolumna sp. MB42-C2]
MRDEQDKENELNTITDDDILSLLKDSTEDSNSDKQLDSGKENSYYDENDIPEIEDTDEDLLALLDMISAQDEANTNKEENSNTVMESLEQVSTPEEAPYPDEMEDILSIDDLAEEIADDFQEESDIKEDMPNTANDMSGIFSDVLSAVDSLKDKEENNISSINPSVSEVDNKDNKKETKEKKKSFWQKIFGKKEDTKKEIALEADTEVIKDKKTVSKKAEKAKKSKAVKKTVKKEKRNITEDNIGEEAKDVKKKKANEKKAVKKKPDKKKVAKIKKEPKVKEVIEDNEDNVKINKLAVIFVMTFFILIGGFVIIGTNQYSYSLDIKNAKVSFSRQRYTEAYKDIYGLDIRKSDKEIYDKIMTVMYVNKELNSYNNYIDIKMYPQALDSLLKGIERYDKYIKRAADLGIKKDMDSVKEQIVKELKNKFNLSEEEAIALNKTDDQTQYSIKVFNTVLEKMK